MREPRFGIDGVDVVYSKAPSWALRLVADAPIIEDSEANDGLPLDRDFHCRYAAIILNERGA